MAHLRAGAGANGSTRVAIDYRPPKDPSSNSVWRLAAAFRQFDLFDRFIPRSFGFVLMQPYNVSATVLADRCPGGSGKHPMRKPPKGACEPAV